MSFSTLEKIFGLVATILVGLFTLGLAESISSGFAGFWGGLPFWIIAVFVLLLTVYDYYDTCLRKKNDRNGH
jgi:hypothetical protein